MARMVSQVLLEDFSIHIRPGSKGECPKCHNAYFSLKPDDTLGKCFHPSCGHFLTTGRDNGQYRYGLTRVLDSIYQDCHQELLQLATGQYNAYTYLQDERGIHPQVITDAMLGAVPPSYDITQHFQPVLAEAQAALTVLKSQKRGRPTKQQDQAEKRLQVLQEAQQKLIDCLAHRAGWLVFFYTDAAHRLVALRLRQPYSRTFVSFKPGRAGMFGRELFTPFTNPAHQAMNACVLIVEGEFNVLQLQSLTVRYAETIGQPSARCYHNACAVGSVTIADVDTIKRLAQQPVIVYDHDTNQAGFELVKSVQKAIAVEACTTPLTWGSKSDLDSYIREFDQDHVAAWNAIKTLIAERQPYGRVYSGTGEEFFAAPIMGGKPVFTPKLLGDALLVRQTYRYTASQLWVYQHGVYGAEGEAKLRADAQTLLGNERREERLNEALHYVEVATHLGEAVEPDRTYINCRNGRLNWKTLEMEDHTAKVFSVAQLPVEHDPAATCPTFDAYLTSTLCAEDIPLIKEIFGWCLIPDTRFERAVMLTGTGKNGKGVLLDLLTYLLGEENVSNVALQDLEENRFKVAELYGKLANIFADLPNKRLQSSSMFKTLVSGDRITAERKHEHPFAFRNHAKLIFSANALPGSNDRTYAFYRRWLIIPFEQTFNGEAGNPKPDMELRNTLKAELPGILNYALEGAQRLYANGDFTETDHTRKAKADYQRSNDSVQTFVEECVDIGMNHYVSKQEFYRVYAHWCRTQNEYPVSQTKLKEELKKLVPTLDEARVGQWRWIGIDLNDNADAYRPYAPDPNTTATNGTGVPF